MAYSEIYVDPSIAGDSGSGTIGDPYGDLEYAIVQSTFDTTNGTRVNIKTGATEVLAAQLLTSLNDTSVSAAWNPFENRPLIFQGYTATAGDGGIGDISGGGAVSILDDTTTKSYTHFVDLKLHNTGANSIFDSAGYCAVIGCEIYDSQGSFGIEMTTQGDVIDCYIHDCDGVAVATTGRVSNCYFDVGSGTNTYMITGGGTFQRNIIVVSGTTSGILAFQDGVITNNSIWSDGGSGTGIYVIGSQVPDTIANNLVEGFSSGTGISYAGAGTTQVKITGGNAVYNCSTGYVAAGRGPVRDYGDDETLTASPFTDAANGDFSPVDTGNVKEGALPQIIGGGLV